MKKQCGELKGCPSIDELAKKYEAHHQLFDAMFEASLLNDVTPEDIANDEPSNVARATDAALAIIKRDEEAISRTIRQGDRRPACVGIVAHSICGITYKTECPLADTFPASATEKVFDWYKGGEA